MTMKYIKTYENFNPVNEELFGIFDKIKEAISVGKEVVNDLVSKMSPMEMEEALAYAAEQGLTPELAKQTANKLKIETPDAAASQLEEIVEPVINESIFTDIKDRIIRFIGLPALTGFLGWLTSIVLRATSIGWSGEPQWIIEIHDKLGAYGGWLSVLAVFVTFITFIITVAKLHDKDALKFK